MTNITLSIADSIYKRMKRHSEIKWSEHVRKIIEAYLDELDKLKNHSHREIIATMFASERVLKKEWDNKEDERWNEI